MYYNMLLKYQMYGTLSFRQSTKNTLDTSFTFEQENKLMYKLIEFNCFIDYFNCSVNVS